MPNLVEGQAYAPNYFQASYAPTNFLPLSVLMAGFGEGGVYLSRGGGSAHWPDCRVKASWLRALGNRVPGRQGTGRAPEMPSKTHNFIERCIAYCLYK